MRRQNFIPALEFYERAAEVVEPVEKRLRDEMKTSLGEDWCAGWWHAVPEFMHAPNGINLLEILRLWSLAKSLDMIEFAKMRYNLLGNAGHWFPGKNAADFDAEKIERSLAANPFAERILAVGSDGIGLSERGLLTGP